MATKINEIIDIEALQEVDWLAIKAMYEEQEDGIIIAYRPSWRAFTGSVTAAIFLQQVSFRWRAAGRKPFYKFAQPPAGDSPYYQEGDSWVEELGFSFGELRGARKNLCVRLKKNELDNFQEVLGEDYLIGMFQDQKHRTWYYFNEPLFYKVLYVHYFNQQSGPEDDSFPLAKSTSGKPPPHAKLTNGNSSRLQNLPADSAGKINQRINTKKRSFKDSENIESSNNSTEKQTTQPVPLLSDLAAPGDAVNGSERPPSDSPEEVCTLLLEKIKLTTSATQFSNFQGARLLQCASGVMTIAVNGSGAAEIIHHRMRPIVERAIGVVAPGLEVRFVPAGDEVPVVAVAEAA